MARTIAQPIRARYLTAVMPELPEVETVARGLARVLVGGRIARVVQRRPDLRRAMPVDLAGRLAGRRIAGVRRRAKYLLVDLDDGQAILAHLGMSGRMTVLPAGAPAVPAGPHDHVEVVLADGAMVRFNDPRRFGLLLLLAAGEEATHPLLAPLGPEPLDPAFDGTRLAARLAGRRTSIKAALLDQRVVAGLGNIYVSESLFWAGISPRRLAGTVAGGRAERLAEAIRRVLLRAIEAGGSTLRDYVQATGELGYFQHAWAVYGREAEPCPGCDCRAGIRRIVQAGRSTFYCAKRQR